MKARFYEVVSLTNPRLRFCYFCLTAQAPRGFWEDEGDMLMWFDGSIPELLKSQGLTEEKFNPPKQLT